MHGTLRHRIFGTGGHIAVAAVVAVGCVVGISGSPAAAAPVASHARAGSSATPTVPLLTGGLLTVRGGESWTFKLDGGSEGGVSYSGNVPKVATTYLMPVDYPDVPQLPPSNYPGGYGSGNWTQALSWTATLGTTSAEAWGTDPNTGPYDYRCTWTLDSARPQTIAPTNPAQSAWAPPYGALSNEDPQCTDPNHQIQGGGPSAGGNVAWLPTPAQPLHAKTLSAPVHEDIAPCGTLQNCTGDDSFDGSVSLRCMLCVTNIDFRQLADPTSSSGALADVPSTGTYDGNRVEVDATVHNVGPVSITTPVNFVDADTHLPLPQDTGTSLVQPVTFPAGSTTHVVLEWNTTAFAWQSGGVPDSQHRIEVLTPLGGAYRDITVLPKPVVLVHGWNSDASTWDGMKQLLAEQNPDWHGYAVGDDPSWSAPMDTDPKTGVSIDANAFTMAKYIEGLRKATGAQHVDLVAHSMGGLISRDYIAKLMTKAPTPPGDRPLVSHLIMLGTPNLGSPCAVPMSDVLGWHENATPTYQLRPDFIVDQFDKTVTAQNGVPFSVMAGRGWGLCGIPELAVPGDLVVSVKSAWWNYTDVAETFDLHTQLTDDASILTSFIKPRLAVALPVVPTPATHRDARPAAAPAAQPSQPPNQLAAETETSLPGNGTTSLAVPVTKKATLLQVVFTAPSSVSATLVSPTGKKVARQTAGGPAAGQPLRALAAASPAAGTWKVVLHQTAGSTAPVALGAALSGSNVVLHVTAMQNSTRHLIITATLTKAGVPVKGAAITAHVRGASAPTGAIRLYDDGRHHDGGKGDGHYGTVTTALPRGHYFVVVKAAKRSTVRFTGVSSGS